jgi:hypothetical protein
MISELSKAPSPEPCRSWPRWFGWFGWFDWFDWPRWPYTLRIDQGSCGGGTPFCYVHHPSHTWGIFRAVTYRTGSLCSPPATSALAWLRAISRCQRINDGIDGMADRRHLSVSTSLIRASPAQGRPPRAIPMARCQAGSEHGYMCVRTRRPSFRRTARPHLQCSASLLLRVPAFGHLLCCRQSVSEARQAF